MTTGIETRLKRLTSVLGTDTQSAGEIIYKGGFFHVLFEKIRDVPGIVETLSAVFDSQGITPIREDELLLEMGGEYHDAELSQVQRQEYEDCINKPVVAALRRAGDPTIGVLEQTLAQGYEPPTPYSIWQRIVSVEIRRENADIPGSKKSIIQREINAKKEVYS